ncbi:radical SAM family heme chaperone HemW [Flagellimonas eckloniae]|uniref:Heme chaperone HemW n=1 Tax=Flagellimonas eckloniae TaxID=346185 RepID=A0A0Q1BHY7_9FLAO|nr:radical SAM family heme chaperone HemW [Allomuricauda eckloniae]KQC30148.1 coproporphyrinogen III oxidase [Allomuricauda eckloniae]
MSGIYIHVPFCKQACHYCDFHFSTQLGKKEAMVKSLQRELELRKAEFQKEQVETIYFGGGTPSVLTSTELEAILQSVYDNYSVVEYPEITLEANPDDLMSVRAQSRTIFQDYQTIGINRLSIGIQSFFDEDLKLMNRAHSSDEAVESLSAATRHFDNISIDLIYGIPGMDNKKWKANIEKALLFKLPHISSYALTVEPKTALKKFIEKGIINDVNDEQAQEQFHILVDVLEQQGYINYEISNFGKEGYFSKNNTSYWQGKKYMGIGPSAHSFDGQNRGWNVRNNSKYIKALQQDTLSMETETLSRKDNYNEYVMTGLRTIWGVSLKRIENDFGISYLKYINQQAEKYLEQELLFVEDGKLLSTKKGKFLVDGIASDLFMLNLGQ